MINSKSKLKTATSWSAIGVAALLLVPGRALALNECGTVNTAANPQTATCTGAFAQYPTGITYDESTLAPGSQGNVLINIAGTTIVNAATGGLTVRGAGNFNAGASIFTGAMVKSANDAVRVQGKGTGTASIINAGTVTANGVGLYAYTPFGTGTATVTNALGGVVLSSGPLADGGIADSGASASIFNNGSVTVNGATGNRPVTGLFVSATSETGAAYASNTGLVVVTGNNLVTGGIQGSSFFGATSLNNSGTLTVTGGSGDTYGFRILGGSGGAIFNNQGGPLSATTTVTGTGNLYAAAATQMEGLVTVDFKGVPITINATGGFGHGILVNGNAGATISVANQVIGNTTYNGAMSISGTGATGIEVSAAGGPIGVTLTNAPLTVNGRTGVANGILIAGTYTPASGPALFSQPADPAVTVTNSDMSVTGASATGVTINGAGPNSATFTGSSLTVTATGGGGFSGATGFRISGGTDASVTTTATQTRGAALNVGGGFFGTGVDLSGSGNLSVSLGDTATVGGGIATGVNLAGGQTQTVTLANPLTATGSFTATGVNLTGTAGEGGDTQMFVHAPTTITATANAGEGAGDVFGIHAQNGAFLLIDGAPTIVASGAAKVAGVDASNNMLFGIDATLGSVTASSTSASANVYGVHLETGGPITLADAGTIDVTGAGTGLYYGVYTTTLDDGEGGPINLTLNNVAIHGTANDEGGYAVFAANQTPFDEATNVTVQQVTTSGGYIAGVGGYSVNGGASTINIGSQVASVHSGGVTTTGVGALGVVFNTFNGPLTITNLGLVSTLGNFAVGIDASGFQGGSVTVNNWRTTTTGTNAPGILVHTEGGGVLINNTTVSTTGANSNAIDVSMTQPTIILGGAAALAEPLIEDVGFPGDIVINSLTATASANLVRNGPDAIHSESEFNNATTVNLLAGGTTSATSGVGVYVLTAGTSAVNIGTGHAVNGGAWGIDSTADFGNTIANAGSLTGGGSFGRALRLRGGTDVVTNSGTLNGYVDISTIAPPVVVSTLVLTDVELPVVPLIILPPSITFNNTGTWNLFGGSSIFDTLGTNVLTNSGTMNVAPNAATATTINILAPDTRLTFNNSGLISLQQGAGGTAHTGDVLALSNATYVGSGNARLAVDANLGNAAVGGSGLQTADRLTIAAGSVAGGTTLVVRDLGVGLPGQFNTVGIPVLLSPGSTAGALTLQGDVIAKGYVDYRLTQSGGNYYLVGLPSQTAFEIVRVGAQAQEFWRRTGDAWADEMRSPHFDDKHGLSLWGHLIYADGTSRSGPGYSVTAINQFNFTPNLDLKNTFYGGLVGLDYSWGKFAVGILGGYGDQKGRFKLDGNHLDLKGFTVGGYARYQSGGFFIDGLFKYDGYKVRQVSNAFAFRIPFDASTYGAELQVGYHYVTGSVFLEPVASLSWTRSDIDSFNSAAAGAAVDFNHAHSLFGNAGLRLGTTLPSGDWTFTPFIGGYAQGDFDRRNRATIAAGPTAFTFEDVHGKVSGRGEIGIVGKSASGLELSANVDGVTGGLQREISARVGIAYHW